MDIKEAEILFHDAALNLSKEKLHFHTIQFLTKRLTPLSNYSPYGSGVLIQIEDQYLIFTASHVTKTTDAGPLYVNTRIGVERVIGSCHETDFELDKNTDLAYILLDRMLGLLLTETYQFLPLTKICHSHIPKETTNYMISGYPTEYIWEQEGDIFTGSANFLLSMADEKRYNYYHFDKEKNFVLNFAGRGVDMRTRNRSDKICEPYGMSGCGLWFLQARPESGKMVLDYVLIGIMTIYKNSKYQILAGNRIEPIMLDLQEKRLFDFDWQVLSK